MSTVSEKRVEANRRNAQKSTGPVTPDGKSRSSRNALKHGLAAETHLPPGLDPGSYEETLKRWNDSVRPAGPAEEALLRTACHAAWKLETLAAAEEVKGRCAVAHAAGERTRARVDRAEQVGRRLVRDPINRCAQAPLEGKEDVIAERRVDDPPKLVRELKSFREGVEWLLERWEELRRILHEEGFWHYPEKIRAIRLLGRRPEDVLSDATVRRITLDCQACHPAPLDLHTELYRCMLGTDGAALYFVRVDHLERFMPSSAEAARADLFRVVDEEIACLETLKSERLDDLAWLDDAAAEAHARIDTSSDSTLLHRYETAAQRALHRSLDLLVKLRKAGSLVAENEPEVVASDPVASVPPAEEGVPGGKVHRPQPPAPNEPNRAALRRPKSVVQGTRKVRPAVERVADPPG